MLNSHVADGVEPPHSLPGRFHIGCPSSTPDLRCFVTKWDPATEPGNEHRYDALLMDVGHIRLLNLTTHKMDLPERRRREQVYVMYNLNPPGKYADGHMAGIFNWTMSYHDDADVYIPFGATRKRSPASKSNSGANSSPDPSKKRKMVAWIVSHCITASGRENYVGHLMKHIKVFSYYFSFVAAKLYHGD